MKLLKVTPVLLLGAFSYTQAALVAITNFNMESAPTKQADGGLTGALATGWTYGNISGSPGTFTFNTTTTTRYYNDPAFADTSPSGGASGTMAGPNFTGLSGTGSGYIQQTLTATVAANTQYTLTAALGHRTVDSGAAATASPVTIELRSGSVSLAAGTFDPSGGIWADTGALPDDIWADATLVFTTSATPAQLGQPLTIRFTKSGASGNYMDFDNVRLDATLVPEPQVAILGALAGLGLLRRRR